MPDFRKKAGAFGKAAAGKARTFAIFAAHKTKNVSRIAKLNVDIATERDTIKRAYSEIGKLYYETHKEDPEGFFVQLCGEIDVAYEAIARMESEIVQLKTKQEEIDGGEAPVPDAPIVSDEPHVPDGDPDKTPEPDTAADPDGSTL